MTVRVLSICCLVVFLGTKSFAQTISLKGSWKFQIGDKPIWADPYFNDKDWETIQVPASWEDEGFHGYDGFAWYRKEFDGKQLSRTETFILNLGYIDDCDEVYVNGKLIGLSGHMPPKFKTAYNNERKYALHPEAINYTGRNVIAIRVFDVTQNGGLVDGQPGIYTAPKNRMLVDLQGLWQFVPVRSEKPASADASWKTIMVPSAWEFQGYYKYDGFAWYKRTFTLPPNVTDTNQDLVLLLGKIDDFDKAYLNGKLIGKTNDGERFGSSQSFNQLRVYGIPEGLLNKTGPNVLEVFVEDMGNMGGIHEGPVGITTRTIYQRYYKQSSNSSGWGNYE
jgi:hypothetical protein